MLLAPPVMAYNPGVSFFIPFNELDPSEENRCIYFTQRGTRCKWNCSDEDSQRGVALRKEIMNTPFDAVNIELLREYALRNCCRRARHQDRIEDVGLLLLLAQRWQDEIGRQAADPLSYELPVSAFEKANSYKYTLNTPDISGPSKTLTQFTTTNDSSRDHSHIAMSCGTSTMSSTPVSSHSDQAIFPSSSTTPEVAFDDRGGHSRYELRTRHGSTYATQVQPLYTSQTSLSEFRPHIAEPSVSDSVYHKMLEPLKDRDFETGALYIFDRESSPGHVKIGWTAKAVSDRLRDWSKCEYEPNLLFSMSCVPHAQRVETLTHHELIKEWRRERMCKAPKCRKSHQEWFEISREKAEQVLSDWAEFIRKAKPYDSTGVLKPQWKKVIEEIERKKEAVSANKLLDCYNATSIDEATILKEQVDLSCAPEIVKTITGYYPEVMRSESCQGDFVCVSSSTLEHPELPKSTALRKSEVSCKIPKGDKLSKSKPSWKIKPMHEYVLALGMTPVKKELTPEEIPLPSSPILESASLQEITPSLQRTQQGTGARIQQLSATNIETKFNTKFIIADVSYNLKLGPSAFLSAQPSLQPKKSPSALLSESTFQTNKQADINTATTDDPDPRLEFQCLPSKIHPSDSLAKHASPRPKIEPESEGNLLIHDIEAPQDIEFHGQNENKSTELTGNSRRVVGT